MTQAAEQEPKVLSFPPDGGDGEPPSTSSGTDDAGRPDSWEPQKNGTILCYIDGALFRLRRPKGGEYRRLREAVLEMRDRVLKDVADKVRDAADPERTDDEKIADAFDEYDQDADILKWFRLVFNGGDLDGKNFRGLSDRSLPDDDDELPTWFLADKFIGEILDHWRSVPRVPGR